MKVKVTLPVQRGEHEVDAEMTTTDSGEVEMTIPSIGTQRICMFSFAEEDFAQALAVLKQ